MEAKTCSFPEPRGRPLLLFSVLPRGRVEKSGGVTDGDVIRLPLPSYFRGLPLPLFITTSELAPSDFAPATTSKAVTSTPGAMLLLLSELVFSKSELLLGGGFWVELTNWVAEQFLFSMKEECAFITATKVYILLNNVYMCVGWRRRKRWKWLNTEDSSLIKLFLSRDCYILSPCKKFGFSEMVKITFKTCDVIVVIFLFLNRGLGCFFF